MAKQVGLFNLRGKIENKSFYKTAGVPETVIRGIPEGLSARVKTADEYANTRLNNAEFKQANGIATFGFNAVPNRKASMMRRFAIAEMTKKGLEYIKEGSGNWGQRLPIETFDNIIVDLLENRAKSGPYQGEFGVVSDLTISGGAYTFDILLQPSNVTDLQSKGIDGYYALIVKGAMAEVLDDDGFVRQHFGVSSINPTDVSTLEEDQGPVITFTPSYSSLGMSPAGYTAAQGAANNGMFCIVSFVPYREVGTQRHSLYEYATYVAIPLGAIPTE